MHFWAFLGPVRVSLGYIKGLLLDIKGASVFFHTIPG